jgi:hypothetical protein
VLVLPMLASLEHLYVEAVCISLCS